MSVAGRKTVVATASELFAGSSVLVGRLVMIVTNMDDSVAVVVGSTLTSGKVYGYTIEPGQRERLTFPTAATVYAQSLGRAAFVEVVEA